MATILVTGANRGLGLEFIKHYLDRGDHVIGTFRDKHSTGELIQMGVTYDKLEIISLDVSSEKSLKTFPNLLGDIAIDILSGSKNFKVYTMDLTKKYIEINADYRS